MNKETINKCYCGKEPEVKPVYSRFGFGYAVSCECGSESWAKLGRSVAIDNWNSNRPIKDEANE